MVFDQFNGALHDDTKVVAKEQLQRELNLRCRQIEQD